MASYSSVQQESISHQIRQDSVIFLKLENLSSTQTEEEIPNRFNECESLTTEVSEENIISNQELRSTQLHEVANVSYSVEELSNSINSRESDVMNILTKQKRPCTPTEENSCSQLKQEPPDPPVSPSKRKCNNQKDSFCNS